METLVLRVPDGTKAKLQAIGPTLSDAGREAVALLLSQRLKCSALVKAGDLCGADAGPGNAAKGRAYLKQYAPSAH